MQGEQETYFDDGNLTPVVRKGNTVRRTPGPWTPAVHALLRHLEAVGFDGAPRVLGFDEQDREILSYVEGQSGLPSLQGIEFDSVLVDVARLLRRYHDAVSSFVPPPGADWQFTVGGPTTGEIICHNDVAPWNTIFTGTHPVAFIDWDFAAPAPRTWDIAYALWRYGPLYADESIGTPAERARRIVLFCDAYGLRERQVLIATIERREQVLYDTLAAWSRSGLPGYVRMWEEGHAEGVLNDLAYLRQHGEEMQDIINGS